VRNRYLLFVDAFFLLVAIVAAALLRFEGLSWPPEVWTALVLYALIAVPVKLFVFWTMGLYRRLWQYASLADLERLALCTIACVSVGAIVGLVILPAFPGGPGRLPYSIVALDAVLGAIALTGARLLVRAAWRPRRVGFANARRALIVGAGAAGGLIVRELTENPRLKLRAIALIDDDPLKRGRELHGVPIAGNLADLERVVRNLSIDEVIIALPSAPGDVVRNVVRAAADVGVPTRTVPGLYELLDGRKSVSALRRVEIADLLRRDCVQTDLRSVRTLAAGKTVLVTGAGGSIGSELCRQLARLDPSCLVVVGRGENSIFELLGAIGELAPNLQIMPVIADVRDRGRLEEVFAKYRPATVFHAAAHKHVPLMEANVAEAILNNVQGTRVVADNAWRYGAERFVLISSDKAVRPSSVMGATKRLAEGVLQSYAGERGRHFVSVRFGNVLGSRGSVIPTFLRQIEAGGPVTITHREMRRFFMTIPEAVQLVLQAGVMAEDAEVFVLDMGEAVRIYDLARDVIRLSGLAEGTDIDILETGIRPGEKLYEELFFDAEHAAPTAHPKILRAKNAALGLHGSSDVDDLIERARRNEPADELRARIKRLVPEYTGADHLPASQSAGRRVASMDDPVRRAGSAELEPSLP
jgi:FlaA1/EpsC-like NDP-sugar epimerase